MNSFQAKFSFFSSVALQFRYKLKILFNHVSFVSVILVSITERSALLSQQKSSPQVFFGEKITELFCGSKVCKAVYLM